MNRITILAPTQVSWQEYKNLRLEALKTEPQAFGSSYADQKNASDQDWQFWLKRYQQADSNWMLFAKEDDNLIGMMGAYQTEENKQNKIATIIGAYVRQEARGKGVAKLLMKHLIALMEKNSEIHLLKLTVNPDQLAAVKLYEHFGFTITKKELTTLGDGIERETYMMEKKIS